MCAPLSNKGPSQTEGLRKCHANRVSNSGKYAGRLREMGVSRATPGTPGPQLVIDNYDNDNNNVFYTLTSSLYPVPVLRYFDFIRVSLLEFDTE